MNAAHGRPSISPERVLKAQLLMAPDSIRSDRSLCEHLDYYLLYRWFLDTDLVEASFASTTFTKNRKRLLRHAVSDQFLQVLVRQA